MKKSWLLLVFLTLMGCQLLKNGTAEPQSLQERTLPKPHYDSVTYTTKWNSPYTVIAPWKLDMCTQYVKAMADTCKQLPVSLRTYTIPVPTKK